MSDIQIAIADDHALFLEGMSALFDSIPEISVKIKALNGKLLLEQIAEKCEPDLVLLDLNMPVMDGLQTLEALQEKHPAVKIIILSMHQDEDFVLHLIEHGAHGYLLKDSTITEVTTAIKAVIANGFFYDDFVIQVMRKGLIVKNRKPVSLNQQVQFTAREMEVLLLLCKELTAAEIAEKLFVSKRTVEGHKQILFEKSGARNTAGLIIFCLKNRILELEEI